MRAKLYRPKWTEESEDTFRATCNKYRVNKKNRGRLKSPAYLSPISGTFTHNINITFFIRNIWIKFEDDVSKLITLNKKRQYYEKI